MSLIYFLVITCCQAQTVKIDERALWDLWCAGTNSAFEAESVLEECRQFRNNSPGDPLAIVVAGIEGWWHLKRGNQSEARNIFTAMLMDGNATVLPTAGDKMARTWLTRMDREMVVDALKKLYLRNVEFPIELDAVKLLALKPEPPLMDQWGKDWEYRRGSAIKGMESQRYVLESSMLGVYSGLQDALLVPYASRIDLVPVRFVPNLRNTIEFTSGTGSSVIRQAGDFTHRINLAYIGSNIIVVTDGSHWSVLPRPR